MKLRERNEMEALLMELCDCVGLNDLLLAYAGLDMEYGETTKLLQRSINEHIDQGNHYPSKSEFDAKMTFYIAALMEDDEDAESECYYWVTTVYPGLESDEIPFPDLHD